MIQKIKKEIINNNLIKEGQTIVVAFSGGEDSTCLLFILNKLKNYFKFNLKAHHINHQIREKESDRDAQFAKDFCNKENIDFKLSIIDVPAFAKKNHFSIEESARILRYNELRKNIIEDKKNNTILALAHHLNDNVETIIHNLIRGSGMDGLIGMDIKNKEIIRPLLNIKKIEISDFMKKEKIPFVFDSSNEDIKYTRNYIRMEIIPRLEKVNDKALEHIAQYANIIKEDKDYIEENAKIFYNENVKYDKKNNTISVSSSKINSLNKTLKIEVIKKIIQTMIPLKDFTKKHFFDIIKISEGHNGLHIDLPKKITLDKKKSVLIFKKNENVISMERKNKK
ncbi:MAG: tRNA lysidine(34) synthetase TilS [Eubacteriales bacterium]|nr:tRNA lysidine(34) synthetase TilS [Eubacteriales bacterium]